MLDALQYMRDMYEQGIIEPEFITTEVSTVRENIYTGKAASILEYTTNYTSMMSESKKAGAETEFFPIYCLKGPNGDGGTLNESVQVAICISSECEHPDEAFKVAETLATDPQMNPVFYNIGLEGKHYTFDENKNLQPTEKASSSGYTPDYAFLYASYIPDFTELNFQISDELGETLPEQKDIIANAEKVMGPKYMVPSGVSDIYDENSASITSNWQEVLSQVMLGSVSVEEGMNNYKNYWQSIDGDQMLAELNGK